jgi:uncharacterized protein
MQLSRHNIVSRLTGSEKYFIVNLLSRNADILDADQFHLLQNGRAVDDHEFIDKGYVVDPVEETRLYKSKYLNFLASRDSDEVQLFFVPAYACNFSCSYCYQDEYLNDFDPPGDDLIRAFFDYIDRYFAGRRKYITVFGGEPLLNSRNQCDFFASFIPEANKRELDIAIVTNGYYLESYIDLLKTASIREVQVTLDGVGAAHDARRPLKNGKSTFGNIVKGIDSALRSGLPVNLRMVIDKDNINELPSLAHFAIDKGWSDNPLFKTQLGRNYELHHCQRNSDRLYTRLGMYEDIYKLLEASPEIMKFHKPAFSVSKFLFEEGKLPDPLFDSCPATKTEWAFDYTGRIYSCTATVGKAGEELGRFYPEVFLNEEKLSEWEDRDVLAIAECTECSLQLACGGGCGAVAKNRTGKICSSDCRPVKELLAMGLSYYFEQETNN